VVFSYYRRLNAAQRRVYRASDDVVSVPLPDAESLRPLTHMLEQELIGEDRARVQSLCQQLANGLAARLGAPRITVVVLAARPSADWGELHGLYESAVQGEAARITLWMRTAQRRRVVAFRTFLRTLLHELGHHLDYEVFRFGESYHTEGFYKRESSLFRQLMGTASLASPTGPPDSTGPRRARQPAGEVTTRPRRG
jgi:hypothetical protein